MSKDDTYLEYLRDEYAFEYSIYHLSFSKRLLLNIGFLHISTEPTDEDKALSKEELEQKIKELKKPWWNFFFHFGI